MAKEINRSAVLRSTNWGTDIYAHILRQYYPGGIVMTITGRDCGLCRNPFAGGARTLHIWFERTDPSAELSDECSHHHDIHGAIPDGDALDFAELHYRQSGQQLLDTLNREMHLHLDNTAKQYSSAGDEPVEKGPRFSFFKGPITNTVPHKSITVLDAWNYITGTYAAERTAHLRSITDRKRARLYKASRFDYATFCGTFTTRSDTALTAPSGLLCLDFDHLPDPENTFRTLLQEHRLTTALLFRSPSGDGLKWIIETAPGSLSHQDYFRAVANYIRHTHHLEADRSGKDISRACFLPHDPQAYINPNYK